MHGVISWFACGRSHAGTAVLWAILFFSGSVLLKAQSDETGDWLADRWQIEAGLPHNSVTALLQSKDHFLWLGTSNGLARFDGVRFKIYRAVDEPGLRSNRILCLHEDTRGTLWIGTDEGGLSSYRDGRLASFTTGSGLSSDTVLCLEEDSAGDLWIGTASGLNRLRAGQFDTFFKTEGLPDDRVNALYQARSAPLLVATERGVCRFRSERLIPLGSTAWSQGQSNFCCLLVGRDGRLWMGGGRGLYRSSAADGSTSAPPVKVSDLAVLSLSKGVDGSIWYGTSSGELWRVETASTNSLVPQRVRQFPGPVSALLEDEEGNLWVGTAGDGLHRLKRRQLRLVPLPESLSRRWAPCVLAAADGDLQLVAGDKGLYGLREGKFTRLRELPLPDGATVQAVCGTPTNTIWIGTLRDGLIECGGGAPKQLSERDGLSDSAIEVLYTQENGGLWVGTRNGGLNYVKDSSVTRFSTPWGFSGNFACALEQDRQGDLWIGTSGDGLFKFSHGQFTSYLRTNGLPSSTIRVLHADSDGSVWIGTAAGLCRAKDGRIKTFTAKQGLAEEPILQLCSDDEGNLWLGSNSGIARVRKAQLNACADGGAEFVDVITFGREDGLPGLQCLPEIQSGSNRRGGAWLWFSTTRGLVVFPRSGLRRNTLPPPVVIERVLVENEDAPFSTLVRVAPGRESLQFQFTALNFTAPGKIGFRYQLENFDHDWSEVTANRAARYPRLPAGDYRFRVQARNNDGVWNEAGTSVALAVVPFWWATLWFRAGLVGAAVAGLAGLYRLRQIRSQEIERLRIRIASDLHDDVGSSLWSITLLSRMLSKHGQLDAQEREDVEEINRISVQTSNSIRDIIWLINPAFDTMQDLVLRTKDFAGTALRGVDYRLECEGPLLARKLPLDFRQNLFFLFKEALTNIARHAQATRTEARIEERDGRWQLTIRDNGVGFDPAAKTSGNGLRNLHARAVKMGADLEIRSQLGEGTVLTLRVTPP